MMTNMKLNYESRGGYGGFTVLCDAPHYHSGEKHVDDLTFSGFNSFPFLYGHSHNDPHDHDNDH